MGEVVGLMSSHVALIIKKWEVAPLSRAAVSGLRCGEEPSCFGVSVSLLLVCLLILLALGVPLNQLWRRFLGQGLYLSVLPSCGLAAVAVSMWPGAL